MLGINTTSLLAALTQRAWFSLQAAINSRNQALSVGMTNTKIGLIPMIGVNDVMEEVFTLEDACQARCTWAGRIIRPAGLSGRIFFLAALGGPERQAGSGLGVDGADRLSA